MKNFKKFYNQKKAKKKKRKEENNESQLNDIYTDSALGDKPPSYSKKNTFLYPPNYGMGEGQRLTAKPGNLQ